MAKLLHLKPVVHQRELRAAALLGGAGRRRQRGAERLRATGEREIGEVDSELHDASLGRADDGVVARPFSSVRATAQEIATPRPGDDLVSPADVVMDRAFTVDAAPEQVWPWLQQLGKRRAGWYFPQAVERLIPPSRRAIRELDPRWEHLRVADVIPDYGGAHETFEVVQLEAPTTLVYRSRRGNIDVSWAITLAPNEVGGTRVHLRLRLGPVRRRWLAGSAGGLFDLLTIAGMAAGLRERLQESAH